MTQEKIQQAVNLFKAGNKKQASDLLLEIVESDTGNVEAWFGLALCSDTIEKKRYFLEKVLEINPQHLKARHLLEKVGATNSANLPVITKKKIFSTPMILSSVMIGILVLCVAWLFYKVNILEKSSVHTQTELSSAQTKLTDLRLEISSVKAKVANMQLMLGSIQSEIASTQSNLNSTRSALSSTINTLSYVQGIAENANNYAHSHNSYSDGRLKQNITEIKDPLKGILSLHGVNFSWDTSRYPDLGLNNDPQIGFIAQDVEQIYPQLVATDESGFKTVDYAKLVPVLVEAIKQQQLMIIDLQRHITAIEQESK